MFESAQWIVLVIAVVALIVPFIFKPQFDEAGLESLFVGLLVRDEKPRAIEVVGATVLAVVLPLGVYAGFAISSPEASLVAVGAPAILFICLSVVAPRKVTEVVLIPCFKFYLIAFAVLGVFASLASLFGAFRRGEFTFYYRGVGAMTANLEKDPTLFWLAVLVCAFMLALYLALLRETALVAWRKRNAPNHTVDTDAPKKGARGSP
jgi:hypothetical protein